MFLRIDPRLTEACWLGGWLAGWLAVRRRTIRLAGYRYLQVWFVLTSAGGLGTNAPVDS